MTRGGITSVAPTRQTSASDSPESWGRWIGRNLEVIQDPQRARMCGFGDKQRGIQDRRPLAPAAVAKMTIKRDDDSVVEPDEVDCSFFLVTVDLWSADGKHEMNLVLHPTSSDRYIPATAPKVKRKTTNSSSGPASQRSGRQSPTPSAPPSSTSQYPQSNGMTPFMSPSTSNYNAQGYPFPSQQEPNSFQPIQPYPPSSESQSWGYGGASIDRPSQHSGTTPGYNNSATSPQSGESNWNMQSSSRDESEPYRTWPQEQSYSSIDSSHPAPANSTSIDPSLRGPPAPSSNEHGSNWSNNNHSDAYGQSRYTQNNEQYNQGAQPQHSPTTTSHPPPPNPPPVDTSMYASAQYAQQQHQQQAQSHYHHQVGYPVPPPDETPTSTIPPLPRHTYTRTLVGPLSANACRLLDEHRKPGIFFLFQDLSIRTEGTFRLRLRLMNIGAPPAPEPGALRVHVESSPILAQTFTQPFIVYSAKRFPGVPDTTALSIALGSQGQKLPLRNRNGNLKQGRKRARDGSDDSGDESDS
ncbi:hypothetical protein QCA50_020142 [Cerrena zonata]|uniref:Velvet domain-containing protein n=1 Tax=Cerrena zonata TaxID=2478898 RepID=A0AAW0F9M6_9APHY